MPGHSERAADNVANQDDADMSVIIVACDSTRALSMSGQSDLVESSGWK